MKQHIRAEDLDIVEDRMVLGGRLLEGNSIVFSHVEKRESLELIVFGFAIVLCVIVAYLNASLGATIAFVLLAGLLSLAAWREIRRPYVLVIEIYQIGIFEVRGFTQDEATVVAGFLDDLRRGNSSAPGRRAGFLS